MTGSVLAALLLLTVAALLWWSATRADARQRRLRRTETLDVATLVALHRAATEAAGPGAFQQPVDVEGEAAPGPAGPMTAPLSGRAAVWHRHRVVRRHQVEVRDEDGRTHLEDRDEVVTDLTSTGPLLVRDGEAAALVELAGPVQGAALVLDDFEEATDGPPRAGRTLGHRRQEWVVEPGTRLFVSGDAFDRDGVLVLGTPRAGAEKLLVSTSTEEQLLAAAAGRSRGLRRWSLVTGAVALVVAVVGAVR